VKLAFSNIAWSPHDRPEILALLRAQGVRGIEIAPTKVWPEWEGATPEAARRYGHWLREEGFEVPALQAVLFGRPDARLFDPEGQEAFVHHLSRVAELAAALGARAVVLGAPKQRDRGQLDMEDAMEEAVDVLDALAHIFAAHHTCLCIEPNPKAYGCNFVVNAREGVELVKRVASPGFGLHLDAAGMFLEDDEARRVWPEAGSFVRHFHISEPNLGDFSTPQVPHHANLEFLDSVGYSGWCSVEMREPALPLADVGPWSLLHG